MREENGAYNLVSSANRCRGILFDKSFVWGCFALWTIVSKLQ